jgi:hypothetical protein
VSLTVSAVQDPPVASDDAYVGQEDEVLSVIAPAILGNDTDVDGDALQVSLLADGAHGSVTLQPDGSFSYAPTPDFNGSDSFTYTLDDGQGGTDTGIVILSLAAVNDAPVAVDDVIATSEDAPLLLAAPGVVDNDSDVDADALSVSLASPAAHGTLVLDVNGGVSYTPNADFYGADAFTYVVQDGQGGSDTANVSITVIAVNDPPAATTDAFSTDEDVPLAIAAPGILANDTDVEGDALQAERESGPSHGELTLNPDGSFLYTPDRNFFGGDTFTYRVRDGNGGLANGTVVLAVRPINDAPRTNSDSYATDEDVLLTVDPPGLLWNDGDVDGDDLVASLSSPPQHGVLELTAGGGFEYTPHPDFYGIDTFTYLVDDGNGGNQTGTATITVNPVNDAPTVADDEYATAEDSALQVSAPGVLEGDRDADGDGLSVSVATWPEHGTLTLQQNGAFLYEPAPDYFGDDTFRYTAFDGYGGSGTGRVRITVTPAQDAPRAAADAHATNEDQTLSVVAPGVLQNDVDVDGDPLSTELVSAPASGALQLDPSGAFSYTPNANFNGEDSFSYRVRDDQGGSDVGSVTITVAPINDAPVATSDVFDLQEDVVMQVDAPGLLGNDVDLDGDPITALVAASPQHGSLELEMDGSFTYTPNADYHGEDGFSYTVSDGQGGTATGAVSLSVAPVNDAPVAQSDDFGTAEDQTLEVAAPGVLGNDVDVDGDPLSVELVTGPAHGVLTLSADGSFRYTPDVDYSGSDTFGYRALDAAAASVTGTVEIVVAPVNDAPTVANDAYRVGEDSLLDVAAPGVLQNDRDIDADPLTSEVEQGPRHGKLMLAADGSFTYTPNPDFFGGDTFRYSVHDGHGGAASGDVGIEVTPVNDVPVTTFDGFGTTEDDTLRVLGPGVLANDTDVDGDPLRSTLAHAPENGTVVVGNDGGFLYVPDPDFYGVDAFTYACSDPAGGAAEERVTILVAPVNDPPTAASDSFLVLAGNELAIGPPGLVGNDADVDGDTLRVLLGTPVSNGTLDLRANGSFTYVPNNGFTGVDVFTYRVTDGVYETAEVAVNLNVEGRGVTFRQTLGGEAQQTRSVSTADALDAVELDLYLAAIASSPQRAVEQVEGMDLEWARVRVQCSGGGETAVEIWMARGNPSPGIVTATFGAETQSALITVSRYSGADASDPLGSLLSANPNGLEGECVPVDASSNWELRMTTLTEGGILFAAVAASHGDPSAGDGYVSRLVQSNAGEPGASILIFDRAVDAAEHQLDGELGEPTQWAVVGIEIRSHIVPENARRAYNLTSHPNPFNGSTSIHFTLYRRARVALKLYNARGQLVRQLLDHPLAPGRVSVPWDAKDDNGRTVQSGVYFARVSIEGQSFTHKIVLLK